MTKSLQDIAQDMRDIDFCTLATIAIDGSIASRPMSNNAEVEYNGESWFFSSDDTLMVRDIAADSRVGVTYSGKGGLKGLFGAPGIFIHVEGKADLVRDKAQFAKHWDKSLERWWPQGIDAPGLLLIHVQAGRIHYWDGEDQGEVMV